MKGTEQDTSSIIIMVLLGIVAVGIIYFMIQYVFTNLIPIFAQGSAQVVSRELADFITISGVAPYKITINYQPTDNVFYNVSIDSRVVTVSMLESNPKPLTISSGIAGYVSSNIAIDNLKLFLKNVNIFEIKKTTDITNQVRQNIYSVTGK